MQDGWLLSREPADTAHTSTHSHSQNSIGSHCLYLMFVLAAHIHQCFLLFHSAEGMMPPPIAFVTLFLLISASRSSFLSQQTRHSIITYRLLSSIPTFGLRGRISSRRIFKKRKMAPNTQGLRDIIDGIMLHQEDNRIRCALLGCGMVSLATFLSVHLIETNRSAPYVLFSRNPFAYILLLICRWGKSIFHT